MSELPPITPLTTPPPNRSMQEDQYVPAADSFAAWMPVVADDISGAIDWMQLTFEATEQAKQQAAQSAQTATEKAGEASDSAAAAEASKNSAQVIAAALQEAAGLPSLAGNKRKALTVSDNEQDVFWQSVDPFLVGDIITTKRTPGEGFLQCDGRIYPKTAYPELAPLIKEKEIFLGREEIVDMTDIGGLRGVTGTTVQAGHAAAYLESLNIGILASNDDLHVYEGWERPLRKLFLQEFFPGNDALNFLAIEEKGVFIIHRRGNNPTIYKLDPNNIPSSASGLQSVQLSTSTLGASSVQDTLCYDSENEMIYVATVGERRFYAVDYETMTVDTAYPSFSSDALRVAYSVDDDAIYLALSDAPYFAVIDRSLKQNRAIATTFTDTLRSISDGGSLPYLFVNYKTSLLVLNKSNYSTQNTVATYSNASQGITLHNGFVYGISSSGGIWSYEVASEAYKYTPLPLQNVGSTGFRKLPGENLFASQHGDLMVYLDGHKKFIAQYPNANSSNVLASVDGDFGYLSIQNQGFMIRPKGLPFFVEGKISTGPYPSVVAIQWPYLVYYATTSVHYLLDLDSDDYLSTKVNVVGSDQLSFDLDNNKLYSVTWRGSVRSVDLTTYEATILYTDSIYFRYFSGYRYFLASYETTASGTKRIYDVRDQTVIIDLDREVRILQGKPYAIAVDGFYDMENAFEFIPYGKPTRGTLVAPLSLDEITMFAFRYLKIGSETDVVFDLEDRTWLDLVSVSIPGSGNRGVASISVPGQLPNITEAHRVVSASQGDAEIIYSELEDGEFYVPVISPNHYIKAL